MDDLVQQAMAKWPHVPACYGWLGLDARGQWRMRDDAVQALGTFNSGAPGAQGSVLRHDKLIGFIQRNYAADERGCWYFQNGPQRVFVELAAAPWIWRVNQHGQLAAFEPTFDPEPAFVPNHPETAKVEKNKVADQAPFTVLSTWVDESGWLYANTPAGLGLVHSQDVGVAVETIEAGAWPAPQALLRPEIEQRFGFVLSPEALTA
jgi:hypothetical protein